MKGKRIGIPRAYFYEPVTISNRRYSAGGPNGLNEAAAKLMDDAISLLKQKGAIIVDPANLPSLVERIRRRTSPFGVITARALLRARVMMRVVPSISNMASNATSIDGSRVSVHRLQSSR